MEWGGGRGARSHAGSNARAPDENRRRAVSGQGAGPVRAEGRGAGVRRRGYGDSPGYQADGQGQASAGLEPDRRDRPGGAGLYSKQPYIIIERGGAYGAWNPQTSGPDPYRRRAPAGGDRIPLAGAAGDRGVHFGAGSGALRGRV